MNITAEKNCEDRKRFLRKLWTEIEKSSDLDLIEGIERLVDPMRDPIYPRVTVGIAYRLPDPMMLRYMKVKKKPLVVRIFKWLTMQ